MEIESYLQKFDRFTKDPTLDAMKYIMDYFKDDYQKLTYIHVAGTNGKGSITEMLNKVLITAGYKVGKFISPHLITFNETICVNNEPISDEEIQEILPQLAKAIEKYNQEHETKVKWFEVITSLALIYFAKKNCDMVVVEVGMGGLNDCTNIIEGEISIIGNIGYDHIDVLGNTIQKIAKHKAGIIKPNKDTIFVEQPEVVEVIKQECKEKNNTLHLIQKEQIQNDRIEKELQYFDYKEYKQVGVNLKGKKQIENASVCLECVDILKEKGYPISKQAIYEGLANVVHKARFETLSQEPTIIFDGGHNEVAIANLKDTIQQYYEKEKKVYILSILNTKDYKNIVKQLTQDKEAIYLFTNGNDPKRYVAKETLYEEASKYTKENIYQYQLSEAIDIAKEKYKDRVIFIVGSFYVYKDVIEKVKKDDSNTECKF